MQQFDPKKLSVKENHQLLLNFVAPRPIAFVSTVSKDGVNNLSPFSFFNAFGANPPMVAFSASRRGKDNTIKDTYTNILETGECVIHAVTYQMAEQMNLASGEFPSDTDEFEISGFTPIDSDIVKPKRVKESPYHIECKLHKMVELGGSNGSGNLAICEVVRFHVADDVWIDGKADPDMLDLIGRNGGNYYTRASGTSIFELAKPSHNKCIGFDNLPEYIKESHVYTANNAGRFALTERIPSLEDANDFIKKYDAADFTLEAFHRFSENIDPENMLSAALSVKKQGYDKAKTLLELTARMALELHEDDFAWNVAVYAGNV
jgi:flavin reductase (DIM6/NTAB) family NADH-FMN oxidoreductase RutF